MFSLEVVEVWIFEESVRLLIEDVSGLKDIPKNTCVLLEVVEMIWFGEVKDWSMYSGGPIWMLGFMVVALARGI